MSLFLFLLVDACSLKSNRYFLIRLKHVLGILNAEHAECPKVSTHIKSNICISLPRDMVGKSMFSLQINGITMQSMAKRYIINGLFSFLML